MNILQNRVLLLLVKVYVVIVLVTATVLSPLALSFVPILLAVWYLSLWRWSASATINLLTEYFMFFAITLLLASPVGTFFSLLLSLPVLLLINHGLEEAAESLEAQDSRYARRLTGIAWAVLLIALVVLGVSLLFGSLSLLIASMVILAYFGGLGVVIVRQLPLKPVEEAPLQQRMVAGSLAHFDVKLGVKTKIGGLLFVGSAEEWLKVSPQILSLKGDKLVITLTLSPTLSGPSTVKLKGQAIDRWGLIQVSFALEPLRLYVIPRARYAAWLARRYLAGTKPGVLPLISNIEALRPVYGLRRGIEYYGSQLYQPGDSLKNIDWKHSLTYNELITKEFAEFHGQSAVILINLAVRDAEEADKLAYKIIVTAISLAQENIPAALAAYDHEDVKITTPILQPRELLLSSLRVAAEMVTFVSPTKYLNPPDVTRLRANISRIRFVENQATKVLTELLRLEYENLDRNAQLNPATKALYEVLAKVTAQVNVVIISQFNHDAEALAFNIFSFTRKGNAVITV